MTHRLITTMVAAVLLLAGCGSDGRTAASTSTTATSSTTTTQAASTTTTAAPVVTVDPAEVGSIDDILEGVVDVLDLNGPSEAEAILDELADEEVDAYLIELFGWTPEELEAVFGRVVGVEDVDFASFTVDGTDAVMVGVIGSTTPDDVQTLIDEHPDVTRIVLLDVPGSIDDEANIEAARLVRRAGLTTHVPADGVIASGGVDFFLAGATRTFDDGAMFGVHSWAAGTGEAGADVPRDDPQHRLYLDFYAEVGIDAEFYWFTLTAAPPEGVHYMTADELTTHRFATAG